MALFAWRRKNIAASGTDRVPPPTLLLRGFRVPEAEAPGRAGPDRETETADALGAGGPDLPGSPYAELVLPRGARCPGGRHPRTAPEADRVIPPY